MDHPRPWLRYVDAGDLGGTSLNFDGLEVDGLAGEKLGTVDGVIVDRSSGRPYYVVVASGGWFTSKYFLLPIGHVGLDAQSRKLVADLERERVKRFPGFDRSEFEQLSDAELNRIDEGMLSACCPGEIPDRQAAAAAFADRPHHKVPSWWEADFYRPDRADTAAREMAAPRSR